MQLTNEILEQAVKAGLAVLGPESEISIPAAHNEGIFYLRAILTALAKGEASVSPAKKGHPPSPPGTPKPEKNPVAEAVAEAVSEGEDTPDTPLEGEIV